MEEECGLEREDDGSLRCFWKAEEPRFSRHRRALYTILVRSSRPLSDSFTQNKSRWSALNRASV